MSDDRHHHEGIYVVAGFAVLMSIFAMAIAMGPCVDQENMGTKVEHLEQRLDNLRDK